MDLDPSLLAPLQFTFMVTFHNHLSKLRHRAVRPYCDRARGQLFMLTGG
jgi:hypothetical protein